MCCKAGEEIEALQGMRNYLSLANPCCTSAVQSLACSAVTEWHEWARDPSLKGGSGNTVEQ